MVCDPQCSAITIRQVDCSDVWHPERLVPTSYFNKRVTNDSEEVLNISDTPPDYMAPDDD